jgi:glutaredoxin
MQRLLFLAIIFACSCSQFAHAADTVYKSVDASGHIVYSDNAPPQNKLEKRMTFEHMPSSPLPASVLRYQEEIRKALAEKPREASPQSTGPRLFTAAWCRYCRMAKAYLSQKGIAFQEIDIESPDGAQALARAGAGTGIPLLLWKGQKIQGYSEQGYDALMAQAQ